MLLSIILVLFRLSSLIILNQKVTASTVNNYEQYYGTSISTSRALVLAIIILVLVLNCVR